jgi:hypothetical protein
MDLTIPYTFYPVALPPWIAELARWRKAWELSLAIWLIAKGFKPFAGAGGS